MKPKHEQALEVFWGLGEDNFWKQIIDGEFHEYGEMVFDEGLHGGDKEDGCFGSLKSGCDFASLQLANDLSMDLYKQLHKKLCAHFKGKETNTEMDASQCGVFRNRPTTSSPSIQNDFGDDIRMHYFYKNIYYKSISERDFTDEEKNRRYKNIIDDWFHNQEFSFRK